MNFIQKKNTKRSLIFISIMNKIVNQPSTTFAEEHILEWEKVLIEFKKTFGPEIYESWIKKISLKKEFNHYVVLSAPTRFVRDWVVSRYADKALDIIKSFKQSIERIEFTLDESKQNANKNNSVSISSITQIQDSFLNYNRFNPKNNFDSFIFGESNQVAYTAAKKVCDKIFNYNPLLIYGGVGMGKTHLLNAIGLNMQTKFNVMFISAERFMYQFVRSIKTNEMVKFKDFFRKANVFIIDDIQFVGGKEAIQEEFFHTFNSLMERGSQIVVSSDRSPTNLDRIQDRIKSRLSGGLVADIQPPDFNLRIKILKSKLDEIQETFQEKFNLSEEVLNYLASEISSNIRDMIGALNRILAFSRVGSKTCGVNECKIILRDIVETNKHSISIENIQKIVASFFQISLHDMLSERRSRSLARPRQIAMYLSKQYTTKSLPEIGRKFCDRDHTTVIHAVKKINQLNKNDDKIRNSIIQIKKNILENK